MQSSPVPKKTPSKKPKSLHKDLTWLYKIGSLHDDMSQPVVRMCLCPTSNIPTDMCDWWGKLVKGKSQWAEVQFLKECQTTGITASFLHNFDCPNNYGEHLTFHRDPYEHAVQCSGNGLLLPGPFLCIECISNEYTFH